MTFRAVPSVYRRLNVENRDLTHSAEVLDQEHLVTSLVVDELVHNLPHDQHAEPSGAQAERDALLGARQDGLGAVRGGAMIEFRAVEAVPGSRKWYTIARAVLAAVTSITLSAVEAGAVLHRVQQHLAERRQQEVAFA